MKITSDVTIIIKNEDDFYKWLEIVQRNIRPRQLRIYRNKANYFIIKIFKDGFVDVITP